MSKDRVDEALTRHFARDAGDATSAARVLAKLGGPLPRQKHATRWPQILLDWQFAPAWPRMAALACCAGSAFRRHGHPRPMGRAERGGHRQ